MGTLKPTTLLALFDAPQPEGAGSGSGGHDHYNREGGGGSHGFENHLPNDSQGANPSLSSTLQIACCGGGGRAGCNAVTFCSPHTKRNLEHLNWLDSMGYIAGCPVGPPLAKREAGN
jgi:hypothetical protein